MMSLCLVAISLEGSNQFQVFFLKSPSELYHQIILNSNHYFRAVMGILALSAEGRRGTFL